MHRLYNISWLLNLKSTPPMWKESMQKFQLKRMLNPGGKKMPDQWAIPAESCGSFVPFLLDSTKWNSPLSNFSWKSIQRLFLPLVQAHRFCLDLEHRFSENDLDLEWLSTLVLVGIPNSSTEGMKSSNGIAQWTVIISCTVQFLFHY